TVVHSEHGLELSTYRRQPLRRNFIRRVCFAWADRVFAVSHALRTYYAHKLWFAENRINVIPNGVDTERFRPNLELRQVSRQRLGAGMDTLVIRTVGRVDAIKDHRTLFRALDSFLATSEVPARLVIVGDGPERKGLEEEVAARNLLARRTTFVGETSDILS